MTTTVTGKNQVTLPADIVGRLGIKRGSQIQWEAGSDGKSGRFKVLPCRAELAQQLLGSGRKFMKPGEDWIRELHDERAEDQGNRNRALDIL